MAMWPTGDTVIRRWFVEPTVNT